MSVLSDKLYLLEYKEKMKDRKMEEHQKQIERIERKKKQKEEQKEYEKGLFLACKRDLKERFEEEFRLQGTKAKYQFYKIENRDTIIKSIAKSEIECDYLETNYNKILNETIKKYELYKQYQEEKEKEIAQEYVEKMRPVWEKEQKQQERKNIINNILLFILNIFAHPFILLTLVILGVFTWVFMGALELGFFHAVGLSIILFIVLAGMILRFFLIKQYNIN